jgi:hypothetical protein
LRGLFNGPLLLLALQRLDSGDQCVSSGDISAIVALKRLVGIV